MIITLKASVKNYKRKCDRDLKHIKNILALERRRSGVIEWLDLVRETKAWILEEPEIFFGNDLPPRQIVCQAVDGVFEGFLEDQRLLANQTDKRFRMPLWIKSK